MESSSISNEIWLCVCAGVFPRDKHELVIKFLYFLAKYSMKLFGIFKCLTNEQYYWKPYFYFLFHHSIPIWSTLKMIYLNNWVLWQHRSKSFDWWTLKLFARHIQTRDNKKNGDTHSGHCPIFFVEFIFLHVH